MEADWGIIGHDHLGQMRDRRDLGLAKVIRFANEYSVPGLAGLSFLRSIVWALVGVDFAAARGEEGRPLSASVIAEGVEALACWHAIADLKQGPRIRGTRKLPLVHAKELTLKRLARGRGYVSQPIRVGVGAALPALGLVEARNSRFNSFTLSERGKKFLKVAFNEKTTKDALPLLWAWLDGGTWPHDENRQRQVSKELRLLSPTGQLPDGARKFFSNLMETAGEGTDLKTRRSLWMACNQLLGETPKIKEEKLVAEVIARMQETDKETADRLIWSQQFFKLYAEAFGVLDKIEPLIREASKKSAKLADIARDQGLLIVVSTFKESAKILQNLPKQCDWPGDLEDFFKDVVDGSTEDVVRALVGRDGHVLRLEDGGDATNIALHPDFIPERRGASETESEDESELKPTQLYRLRNLCALGREVMQ